MATDRTQPRHNPWRESSYNAGNEDCVEVADQPGGSAVRDTQNRENASLQFGSPEWRAFLTSAKNHQL